MSFSRWQRAAVRPFSAAATTSARLPVGKCCDLFLIDSRRLELVGACFDPKSVLATVGVRGAVDYTVVQGCVTVEQGHLVTVDEESLAREVEEKCRAYLNR